MSSLRRLLAENLMWWLVPLLLVLGIAAWILVQGGGAPEPTGDGGPFQYDAY